MIDIREAHQSDLDSVLVWVNDPKLWYVDGIGSFRTHSAAEFKPVWQELIRHNNAWMMLREERPVGQIGWVACGDGSAEVYVTIGQAADRRVGYGRAALGWLEARAANMDLRRLVARVLDVNAAGLDFFAALGYRPVPSRATILEREDDRVMLHWLEKSVPRATG